MNKLPYEPRIPVKPYFSSFTLVAWIFPLITNEKQEEMIKRYFKGVGINSLAVQFDCTVDIIKQILTNRGIEIVSNEIQEVKKHWYGHKRRKQ